VSPKKRKVLEDGLSKMQKQMEFMFGEMMSRFEDRFEKLETKVESGLGKKGREALAGNSTKGAEYDFNHGSEFNHSRRRVLLETQQKEPNMILTMVVSFVQIGMNCMRLGQGGVAFGQIGILGIGGILMIWVM
jgi:hypothetical protein